MMRYRHDAAAARPKATGDEIEVEARGRYDADELHRRMEDLGADVYGTREYERLKRDDDHQAGRPPRGMPAAHHRNDAARRSRDDEDEYDEASMYRPRHVGSREIDHGDGDRADDIRNPAYRRGYKYERRKHPNWSHEQLLTYVDRRLLGDRHAYDPERIAEETRTSRYAKMPHSEDGCATCRHYHPYLTDNRAGCCDHESHHGKQVLCDQICPLWER
jgi:hypothetical protein